MRALLSITCLLFLAIGFTSCSKDANAANNTGAAIGANTFTWVEGSTTLSCDSAYASSNFKTIFATKGGGANRYYFEINLASIAIGNYTFPTSPNAFSYVRPSNSGILVGSAGGVQITANANNTISGNGVATISSTERVNFTFTNLPIR
jgi:hypothetical protein